MVTFLKRPHAAPLEAARGNDVAATSPSRPQPPVGEKSATPTEAPRFGTRQCSRQHSHVPCGGDETSPPQGSEHERPTQRQRGPVPRHQPDGRRRTTHQGPRTEVRRGQRHPQVRDAPGGRQRPHRHPVPRHRSMGQLRGGHRSALHQGPQGRRVRTSRARRMGPRRRHPGLAPLPQHHQRGSGVPRRTPPRTADNGRTRTPNRRQGRTVSR